MEALPDTLARLAEALPERFPHACQQYVAVMWQGKQVPLFHTSEGEWHRGIHVAYLEGALREECRARNLDIEAGIGACCWATLYPPEWSRPSDLHTAFADTPAHALARALLAALSESETPQEARP